MTLTDAERQFIEAMRQASTDFRVEIKREGGAWEVELSENPPNGKIARGVGATFGAAWDNVEPWFAT
jgi:hypothetical protein